MGLTDLETIPETGAVFTIGRSRFADNIASHFFIRKDPVVSITCGDEHSAVICQTGRLFVFGSNDWGQLGLGHRNHISKPSCVKALKPEKVTHVACGRAHTLICTGAQKIFTCGSDQEGQLGRGTSAIGDSASSPVLVYDSGLAGSKIVQIAAGSHHSLALLSDGGVFAWGSNLEGQLGLPDVSGLVNKPTKVHIPEPVKQIGAGYYHSTFLTESGLVYVCGESDGGKLGIDVNFSTQVPPKQMQLPSPAMHVACGGHHTVILAENGNLYCTGNNSSGQLGLGTNVTEIHTPKLLPRGAVQDETICQIACGESHTAIVTESGKLFTCGDGRHGKLGLEENENNVHELTFAPRYKELFVTNVACGGCHTILVGRKRGTNNHTQMEMENMQTEHPQKRSSLPPLKLPVNRRQSETRDDKISEIIKDHFDESNGGTESMSNIQTTMEATSGKIEENVNNNEENVANNIADPMNNIRDAESPGKTSQKSSNEASKDVSSNDMSNETKTNVALDEMSHSTEESKGSKLQNGNEEPKSDEEISESKINTENNVQEEIRTRVINNEENNDEMNNETETAKSNIRNEEVINNDNNNAENNDGVDNKQSNNAAVESETIKDTSEPNSDNNTKEEISPEKPISPTTSTPPPKPPRLKPGSENSSMERTSSMETESEDAEGKNRAENENIADKEQETTDANETTKKEETGSRKSTTKCGSSKSVRSRVVAEETIEIDNQNDKEKIIEEEKVNSDNTQDDADVVQSPPPKTGKISKIFKTRKTQAIENGAKTTSNVNTKSKSKTCTIL